MILTPAAEIYRRYTLEEQLIDWYEPLVYQRDAYLATAPFQLFEGSNRSGKTETGVAKIVKILLKQHPTIRREGPQKVRVVSTTLTEGALDVTMDKLKRYIPVTALRGRSWSNGFNAGQRKIYMAAGDTIQLMASTQEVDNFRGAALDIVWFDEEPPEAIYNENITRLGDKDGIMIMTMTPHKGMSWTYNRLVKPARNKYADIAYYHFSVLDNYKINREAHIKKFALKSDREIQVALYGKRVALEGLVYSFDEKYHVTPPIQIHPMAHLYLGVDFGLNNPMAGALVAIEPSGMAYVIDEYYETGLTIKDNAVAMGTWLKDKWGSFFLRSVICDPNSGAQRSAQTNERNIDVFRKNFNAAFGRNIICRMGERGGEVISYRIDQVANRLALVGTEPRLKVFRTCFRTIDEFENYVYPNRRDGINRSEKPKEYMNHLMNAIEYVFESRPRCTTTTPEDKTSYYQYPGVPR